MEIILAKSAGFCPGVRRAVDMVYEQTKEKEGIEPVYTYGPIIHNDEVVKDLEEKGVKVIHSLDELDHLVKGTVIIRSHGVSRHTCETIEAKGFHIVDATCPFVKRIHNIVEEQGKEGRDIIIIGNPEHPEVQGIQGWCLTPSTVIHTVDEAVSFSQQNDKKLCIISQTTFNYIKFKELVEILCKKGYDINCINSICNATAVRQEEARTIASKADAMIVIGDKNSSNTQKLYEISKKECENTYYIQTLVDLDLTAFESIRNVGITAGASTPNNIIEEVHTAMSEMSFEQLLEASLKTIRNGEVV